MNEAKYISWLDTQLAEHTSKEDLSPGDLRRRVGGTMAAAQTLRRLNGDLLGLDVSTMDPALLSRLSEQFLGRFEQAVEDWRVWLEREYGGEGTAAFQKIGENCGYFAIALVPLRRSEVVDAAIADLLSALDDVPRASAAARRRDEVEDGESIGYYMAPPTTDARLLDDLRAILPAQVEGLYAALDTLDIFATRGAGGKCDEAQSDYVVIEPLADLEELSHDDLEDICTLHRHDMGRILAFNPAGELWTWNRFEPEPKRVAPDVATYLRGLAAKYR
jgi:hypothetical protein